jgi:hypothetical protein
LLRRLSSYGNSAQNIVSYGERRAHLSHVMDSHHVRAGEYRGGHRGSGRELGCCVDAVFILIFILVDRRLRQERLAGGPHQDGILQLRQIGQASQNFRILLFALSKTQAGVDDNRKPVHTGASGAADGGVEIFRDGQHDIRDGTQLAPSLRCAAHVVENQAGIVLNDSLCQQRIPREAAGVVDDFSAMLNGQFRHFGFVGVHRNWNAECAFQTLQHRNQAANLFRGRNARAAGFGGFSADIDDICALFLKLDRAGEGAVGVKIEPAIGERIGRDVEDAHDEGAFAETNLSVL